MSPKNYSFGGIGGLAILRQDEFNTPQHSGLITVIATHFGRSSRALFCVSAALAFTMLLGCGSGLNAVSASPQISCVSAANSVAVGEATNVIATAMSPMNSPLSISFEATGGALTPQGTSALLRVTSPTPQSISVTCYAKDDFGLSASSTTSIEVKSSSVAPPAVNPSPIPTSVVISSKETDLPQGGVLHVTSAVAATTGTPTGNISVLDEHGVSLAKLPTTSAGTIDVSVTGLTVGTHSLVAQYDGNAIYASSTSRALVVQVHAAAAVPDAALATQTVLQASTQSVQSGGSTTLTAHVSAASGTPEGTVTFVDGSSVLGSVPATQGIATLRLTSLSQGTHQVTARYLGTSAFLPSSSTPVSITVTELQAAAKLTIAVSPTAPVAGNLVTVRVSVTSASNVPTGTVTTWIDHGAPSTLPLENGTSSVQVAFPAGSHTIEAAYSGDAKTYPGSAVPFAFQVTPKLTASTTTLSVSPSAVTVGSPATLTASVAASGAAPTGSVAFLDSGKPLGSAALGQDGRAVYTLASVSAGSHSISAQYSGSTSVAASTSSAATITPQLPPPPVISCIASPSSLVSGEKAVIVAKVLPSAALPVKFTFATSAGALLQQADQATLDSSGLPEGPVRVTCTATDEYNQQSSIVSSVQVSSPIQQTVTTLTVSATIIQLKETASFHVTVTSPQGPASGQVTILDGASPIGMLTLAAGAATFNTAALTAGDHSITASFSATGDFSPSSSKAVTLAVKAPPIRTTTTLMAPPSAVTGSSVTLISIVKSDSDLPTGVVQFYQGTSLLGSGVLTSGAATFVVPSLSAGSYTFTAQYGGSVTMANSSSATSTLTVSDAPAPLTIQCSPNVSSVVRGEPVVVTASTASAANLAVKTTFTTDKGSLDVSGNSATLNTTNINPGAVTFVCTATDTLSRTASSTTTVQVTASALPTTTAVTSSPAELFAGRTTNLTVLVSAASGAVSGQVSLFDGGVSLGSATVSNGAATVSTSSLAAGMHQLVAKFTGSEGFAGSTSAVLTVTVKPMPAPPVVTCAAMPTSVNVGDTVTLTSTVSSPSLRPVTFAARSSAGQLNVNGTSATLSTAGLSSGQVSFQCEGQDDLGQRSVATSLVWINVTAGEQAKTAFTFVDSVGVNVHLHYNNTPYAENFAGVLASMKSLGVRHYRSGIDPHAYDWEYANAEKLAAAGIKADWLIDPHDKPSDINAIASNAPHSIELFEGPNEDDADVGPVLTEFTRMLHDTVRSNPATANVPIIAPTMTQIASVAAQPSLAPWVDFGSMHDYYTPRHPETEAYGGFFLNCGAYGSMDFNTCVAGVTAPGRPVMSTETGYISGTQSDEVLGKYIARTLFLHLNKGVMRTYLYEFTDEVFSPNFGLVHEDLSPKPAYTGLKNLLSLFNDEAFSTPSKVDYSLLNTTADVQHALFQKQDGTILLVMWRGVASANPVAPYETYNVATQQVSVRMGTPVGAATAYTVLPSGDLSQTQVSAGAATTSVTIGDGITVLAFAPVGR